MQRIIGSSELLGGILAIVGYAITASTGYRFEPAWQVLPGLALAVLSMTAGAQLLRERPSGVRMSLFAQLSQVLAVSAVSHFRYVAFAGPFVQLIVGTTGFRLHAGAGGGFIAVPWSQTGGLGAPSVVMEGGIGYQPRPFADSTLTVAINFVAVYFAWHLWRLLVEQTGDSATPVNAPEQPGRPVPP
jgi:hypothetical protein